MDTRISVIVPTYNRADLIAETLNSILKQSHKPAEIVVIDDGSSDNTEAVVRRYGSAIRYVYIENSGGCRARNVGVDVTSSPWIAFCDSDDLWDPRKLELQIKLSTANPDVEYSFTNFRTVVDGQWSSETKFDTSPADYWVPAQSTLSQEALVIDESMFERLLVHQPIFPSTVMMKRSFFEAIGPWDESLGRNPSEDFEFHLRCVGRTPIGIISAPVVGIRKHTSNFSGSIFRTTIGQIEILRYVLKNNPAASRYSDAIEEQIVIRSACAAHDTFTLGQFDLFRELLKAVPPARRSWKLSLKGLIACSPGAFGQLLRRATTSLSSLLPD